MDKPRSNGLCLLGTHLYQTVEDVEVMEPKEFSANSCTQNPHDAPVELILKFLPEEHVLPLVG